MNPFDQLPSRVKVVAALGYFGSVALVLFVPLLWRDSVPTEQLKWIAPGFSVVWFGGALLVGRGRGQERAAQAPHGAAALRRLRRQRVASVFAGIASVLFALVLVAALVGGNQASDADQRLLDTQPRHHATVVAVTRVNLGRELSYDVDVLVEGRRTRLTLPPANVSTLRSGDALDVVIDPTDPSNVLPTTAHDDWAYTRTGMLVLKVSIAIFFTMFVLAFAARTMRPSLFRAARRANATSAGQIVAVRDWMVTVSADGRRWLWSRRRARDWLPQVGASILLVGTAEAGALVFLDDGHTHWPGGPLVAAPDDDADEG